MDGIMQRVVSGGVGAATLEETERAIAKAPGLEQLTPEQRMRIAEYVLVNRYAAAMNDDIDMLSTDYVKEKTTFLDTLKSDHTRSGYTYAFKAFESYLDGRGIANPLKCTAAIADDWLNYMTQKKMASATVRRNAAGMSSFFTFMYRRTDGKIRNPFVGTKALPTKTPKKQIEEKLPTTDLTLFAKDVDAIIDNESDFALKAIIMCMARRGLRAGAFQNMSIRDGQFFTQSKGKRIHGDIPAECVDAIKAAGLKLNAPFKDWTSARISATFRYNAKKLYENGKTSHRYSCHDLRHYFALTEYTETHDIYKVSQLLGHASVQVTQIYLRGLKVSA